MNKTKHIGRVLVPLLALALLVGSVFGIGALAASETDKIPQVMSKNVAYGSELYLYYAVPASSIAEGESASLGVYDFSGKTLLYTVTEYDTENVFGESCYIFRTRGVAPKDLNSVEYVRALSSDGSSGELVSYSLEQYLLDKLYSEGYVRKSSSDGQDYTRRSLYLDLLKYSETAQQLLYKDELASGDIDPVGDADYLGVVGGAYVGYTASGATATLTYGGNDPVGYEFGGYTVASYDKYGNLLSSYTAEDGDSVTVNGLMCAYPIFNVKSNETHISNGTYVAIVAQTQDELDAADALSEALTDAVGTSGLVAVNPSSTSVYDVVIVISNDGDVAPSSVAALAATESTSPFREARFAAYAHDSRIEISYDVNEYTSIQVLPYGIREFIADIIGDDGVHLEPETTYTKVIDLVVEQDALDQLLVAEQWDAATDKAISLYGETNGNEIIASLKAYYAMFKDSAVDWYANLYDPGIGGFYVTTSGKMYYGYLPTIESTRQAMTFLVSSGMIKNICENANWVKVLPETMRAQMIYYVLSLQDENGYFYNPQLTKAQTDAAVSRRGRDLRWGTQLLAQANVAPIYPTPTGGENQELLGKTADQWWESTGIDDVYKPDVPTTLAEYESGLTSSISESIVSAVSKVILAATDSSTAYLESYEAFAAYLDSKDIDANPYSVGNELNATYSEIKAYSEKLYDADGVCPAGIASSEGIDYSGMTMQEMLLAWIEAHINDNGLFGDDGDGIADDYLFQNTNGFFKIISIYTNWKIMYPQPEAATEGLLRCLRSDEPSTTNICEVYNAWSALSSLKNNVKNYASDDVKASVLGAITDYIGVYGKYAIDTTTAKQSGYQKEDGTFSHRVKGSVTVQQGNIPVGAGIDEGNVDAMGFGINGTVDSIVAVLELTEVYKYTEADFMRYLDIILKLEPVTSKSSFAVSSDQPVTTFENAELEDYAGSTDIISSNAGNSYGIVAEDDSAEYINHVLEFNKEVSGDNTGMVIRQSCTSVEEGADMAVLEFKFKATDLQARLVMQITLGTSSSASPFKLVGYTSASNYSNGAQIYIDNTSYKTDGCVGEWITVRVEYSVTSTNSEGVIDGIKCEMFVNGKSVKTITSIIEGKTAPSVEAAQVFSISMNNSNCGKFYFDDMSFIKKNSANQ